MQDTPPRFHVEDTRVLNQDGKLLFMMGASRGGGFSSISAISELQDIKITKLGLAELCRVLNISPAEPHRGPG